MLRRRVLLVGGVLAVGLVLTALVLGVHDMSRLGCGGEGAPGAPAVSGALTDRLARAARCPTLRLEHRGRRTGKAYGVTIWFVVDGETIYLTTMNRHRQWVRNVTRTPEVRLQIGPEQFDGTVGPVTAPEEKRREYELLTRKYWTMRLMDWVLRVSGRLPRADFDLGNGGFYRVTLAGGR